MRIPSYDDLTPSIPDIAPGEALTSVAALLGTSGPVVVRQAGGGVPTGQLFAALHGPSIEVLAAIARDFSPRLERHAGGTIVLDVAGLQRLLGEPPAMAGDLVRAGAPRVAIATTCTTAMLLARARPGITVATDAPGVELRDVPLAVLAQLMTDRAGAATGAPGAGPRRRGHIRSGHLARVFEVLGQWGLTTLDELAALPSDELSARLGPEGLAMQRLARGIDPRPLVPDPGTRRFIETFELEWPIDTLEPLSFVFARLLDPLTAALARADRGAIALRLELRLVARTSHARTLPLPAAMRDPRVLRTLLLLDLESHPPSAAVDAVSLELDPAPARIVQFSLLERALPSPETLATLMARLGALVGDARCGAPVLLDTNRPDAFAINGMNSQLPTPNSQGASFERSGCDSLSCVLRRFRPPVAVRVAMEAGRPVHVAIDRRGMPGGAVRQAAGPWRTSGGWWERQRWDHDEWDVALSDGAVCRLVRDRDSGHWFLGGVVD